MLDEHRPKHARCTLTTPPLAASTREDSRRLKDIVARVGKQAGYHLHEEYANLLKLSIENRQILVEASGNTVIEFAEMQLAACVSVAAKKDVNFYFDIEKACRCRINDSRLDQFVQAELTIALKAPPLRRGAIRIIKDSKTYWANYFLNKI